MVCRGGPWKVPWYAVEDTVEGFSAGGATACREKGHFKVHPGEQDTATAGTAGRGAVPPSLDFPDGDRGKKGDSPKRELPSDMLGSGSAEVSIFHRIAFSIT